MKRLIKLAALTALAVILLSGCVALPGLDLSTEEAAPEETLPPLTEPMYTDREALYQYYNQVNIGDTLEALTEKFGEPEIESTDNGDTYLWVMDDGYGFAGVFFNGGKLRAKALYYKDVRQLGQLSAATSLEQFTSLNSNYTYEMTCGLLGGRSMEVAQIAQDSSLEPEIKRVFVWCNEKGSRVEVLFKGNEQLESVSYSVAESN